MPPQDTQTVDSGKKQLPTLDVSQPVVKPKKPAEPLGDETIESFAKRIRTRFPKAYDSIPDGKLVNDWLAKYPQYESRFKAGETYKANLSAYWDETKKKWGEAGSALVKGLPSTMAMPFLPLAVAPKIAGAAKEVVMGPVRELAGRPQPGQSLLSAPKGWQAGFFESAQDRLEGAFDILLGGDPGSARMNLLANRKAEAAADVFAVPIVGLLAEPLLRGLPGLRSGEEAIGATAKSNAALMTLMGRELPGLAPAEMAERTAQLGTIWKQAARESGITDKNISRLMPTREPFASNKQYLSAITRGNQLALDIAERAVDIAGKPLDTLMETYGGQRVGTMGNEIAKTLRMDAAETADEGVAKALAKLADKVDGARTMDDLNKIKKHANKEAAGLYGTTTGKAINSSAQTVYAYKLAGDAIRDRIYPALKEMAGGKYQGIDLIDLGKRESDAIALRDGMQDIWQRAAGDQANKEALSFGQYVFGEGREHSLYSRHIYRRALEKTGFVPGPQGVFNQVTKTATGELGTRATGEKVAVGRVGQKSLPPLGGGPGPGPNTYFFDIPTGLPHEVTAGKMPGGLTRAKRPPVPESEFSPETRIRRGDSGLSPIRLTDPEAPGDPFRYYTTSGEGEVASPKHPESGVYRTQDIKQAQSILDRLQEYYNNHPSEQRTLQPALDNLRKQVTDYRAYEGRIPPTAVKVTPGKPGVAQRNRGLKRLGIGAAGVAGAGASEREQQGSQRSLPPLQ